MRLRHRFWKAQELSSQNSLKQFIKLSQLNSHPNYNDLTHKPEICFEDHELALIRFHQGNNHLYCDIIAGQKSVSVHVLFVFPVYGNGLNAKMQVDVFGRCCGN